MLVVCKLLGRDLTALIHSRVGANLLQRQQVGPCVHHSARNHYRGHIESAQTHQTRRHRLVAAGHKHAAVKPRRFAVNLNHRGYHVAVRQRVVYAVVPLRNAVANVGGEVSRATTTLVVDSAHHLIDELHQVRTSGVRVAIGALDEYLRLVQILNCPTHTDLQRIILGRERTHPLTIQLLCHLAKSKFPTNLIIFSRSAYLLPHF